MQHTETATTHLNQVLKYFTQMDLVFLDLILDDNRNYQNLPKTTFLRKLGKAFRAFNDNGNTQLTMYPGICSESSCAGAHENMEGFCFIGENSSHYLPIVFHVENDYVVDIFECSNMEHKARFYSKALRIYIDNPLA